jgi:hypothetical protein
MTSIRRFISGLEVCAIVATTGATACSIIQDGANGII